MKILRVLLLIPALALAACVPVPPNAALPAPQATPTGGPAAPATPAAGVQSDLAGTSWQLVSLGPAGAPAPVLPDATVTLEFGAGGQAGGNGGCNSYSGTYQVQDGTLAFDQIVSTLRACVDNSLNEQERSYLTALQAAGPFEVAGDHLTIWYDNRQSVLNFATASTAAGAATPTARPATGEPLTPTAEGGTPAVVLPALTPAEPPERVSMAAGVTSTQLSSLMPSGPGVKQYVLAVSAGQALTVSVTSDGVPLSLIVEGPAGGRWASEATPADGGYRTVQVVRAAEAGDHRVTLAKAEHTPSTNYMVEFTVQ